MITYEILYRAGNTYKTRKVNADCLEQALKKARLNKSVIDIKAEAIICGFDDDFDDDLRGFQGEKVKVIQDVPTNGNERAILVKPKKGTAFYTFSKFLKAV